VVDAEDAQKNAANGESNGSRRGAYTTRQRSSIEAAGAGPETRSTQLPLDGKIKARGLAG